MSSPQAVILVGHGGIPADFPPELVSELKREEARSKAAPSARFRELDARIRSWPRTPENDPYKAGLEAVLERLAAELPGWRLWAAYNEFCRPSLAEAFAQALSEGIAEITVISTMYTRGGSHSEHEIPAILRRLKSLHPRARIRYAWPFDLGAVARMLGGEVRRAQSEIQPL
ncbi:MAG: CbiX/SirB N-terminal domain-containing protein [Elusimicrobia bacterium]|nr:CbiX/SirB N-terminal domain-containing protein [Elusimicrobiota bacterium]